MVLLGLIKMLSYRMCRIVKYVSSNKPVTSYIPITNTVNVSLKFKIRTMKPSLYTVVPSTGTLMSQEKKTIKITLMSKHELGNSSHKFMALVVQREDSITMESAICSKTPDNCRRSDAMFHQVSRRNQPAEVQDWDSS